MLNKLGTKNPLKILFILVYKSYEGNKSDKGIEYFSATCFYLVILYLYILAFIEFFGIREIIFDSLFEQNKFVIFLFFTSISILSYFILKKSFHENLIKEIKFSKKERILGNAIMWFVLIFALFIGIIANNYNRCNVFSIKPGYGFEKNNPKCCSKCE